MIKNNIIIANKTYAEVISGKTQKPKRIPRIIIKKTKKEEIMEKINEDITHYLTKERRFKQTVYTKRQKRKQ